MVARGQLFRSPLASAHLVGAGMRAAGRGRHTPSPDVRGWGRKCRLVWGSGRAVLDRDVGVCGDCAPRVRAVADSAWAGAHNAAVRRPRSTTRPLPGISLHSHLLRRHLDHGAP